MRVRILDEVIHHVIDKQTGVPIITFGHLSVETFRINPDAIIKSEPNTPLRRILEDVERIRRELQ